MVAVNSASAQEWTVLLGMLVVLAAASGAAIAQSGETDSGSDPFGIINTSSDTAFGDGDGDLELSDLRTISPTSVYSGYKTRFGHTVDSALGSYWGEDPSADAVAENTSAFVNNNNESIRTYINANAHNDTNLSEYNVIKVIGEDERGNTATRYVVGDVSNGNLTSLRVVNSTPRTVDLTVMIDPALTEQLPTEIRDLHSEFVAADQQLTKKEVQRLGFAYKGQIEVEDGDVDG